MDLSFGDCLRHWGVDEVLEKHPGLSLAPTRDGSILLTGVIDFHVRGPSGEPIEDSYQVRIRVPRTFPQAVPMAWETGKRIPGDFHALENGGLCLGAPIQQRMILHHSPSLITFVDKLLIPYLFGFSFFEKHGNMPFDELAQGEAGLRQHVASMFRAPCSDGVFEFLRLAGLKKRRANKHPCPCGSKKRLGRCHNRVVNRLRDEMGRQWFASEYERATVSGKTLARAS